MTAMNTVLVSGAMGQVGRRLVQILLERGRKVIALDLNTPATSAVFAELQRTNTGAGTLVSAFVDLTQAETVSCCVEQHQPDAIVHLAAIVSPTCYANPELAHRINVGGTRHLVEAAQRLTTAPLFIKASSSAVYGSRNPHRQPEPIDPQTPVNPVDCYGFDKVDAERLVAESGLPYALMRLGGVISPDAMGNLNGDYMLLMRATPWDNRVHVIDAREAALAFANAVDRAEQVNGRVLLLGGNQSCRLTQEAVQDDVMEALGMGRLGPSAGLRGDPDDDGGWGLTDWFDTTETEDILHFQHYDWRDTVAWVAASAGKPNPLLTISSPLIRVLLRAYLAAQRKWERRGSFANPWALISKRYGARVLMSGSSSQS